MDKLMQILLDQSSLWLPRIGGAALILLVFFIASKIVRNAIIKASERLKLDNNLASLLARISGVSLAIFGVVTALGTLGVNVSALVAGLGLTGFALGFALKDTISNLLSGVLILLYEPFRIGDTVRIAGYEGVVVFIDLRYTELDSAGDKVLIPNSRLFTDPITVLKSDGRENPASTEE